jgi:hypothetical protein
MGEDDKTYDEPSEVTAEGGDVKVVGPDDVNVKLTPDAADETSDRLLRSARDARIQGSEMSDEPDEGSAEESQSP